MRAFTFPGQGSQAVGMGMALAEAFPAARHLFQEVDDALSEKLSRLIFEGPGEDLMLTENAQPALMAVSLAVVRAIESEGKVRLGAITSYVAGHSLGEYSALAAAGAIGVADTARLLRTRGLAMQKAVPVGEGAMAAVLGLDLDVVLALVDEARGDDVLAAANDNGAGQVVISGTKAAVERAAELAKSKHGKRAMMLPVSAPFHCPLMRPAADAMADALEKTTIAPPVVPVVANVTAEPTSDPDAIRGLLVEQVTGLVRWRESVLRLGALGVDTMVEAGAGKVLTGMAKRILPEASLVTVNAPADVEAFLKTL